MEKTVWQKIGWAKMTKTEKWNFSNRKQSNVTYISYIIMVYCVHDGYVKKPVVRCLLLEKNGFLNIWICHLGRLHAFCQLLWKFTIFTNNGIEFLALERPQLTYFRHHRAMIESVMLGRDASASYRDRFSLVFSSTSAPTGTKYAAIDSSRRDESNDRSHDLVWGPATKNTIFASGPHFC